MEVLSFEYLKFIKKLSLN